MVEQILKGMEDLKIAMVKKLEDRNERRCIWCDSIEHLRNPCAENDKVVRRGIIFCRDRMAHNSIKGQQLSTNFTKGEMKKLMEDAAARNLQATYYASSTGIRVEEGQRGSGYWA